MAIPEPLSDLAAVLAAAKRRMMYPGEEAEQRVSFAYGNGNIDDASFSRATMSIVVPPTFDAGGTDTGATLAPNAILHRHDVEGALRQADVAIEIVRRFTGPNAPRFTLDTRMIVALHDALRTQGEGGGIRTMEVRIRDSALGPIAPDRVPRELDRMCETINSGWDEGNALDLAAFALWRLNWIHPFEDGNGRTARALSYLILNLKLGGLVPGTPTIPEQLLQQRAAYLDALAQADISARRGAVDLTALRDLLGKMLRRQLEALPAFSSDNLQEIDGIVARRLSAGRDAKISSVFGTENRQRLWSIDDHVVLQLGPEAAIVEAERRHWEQDNPFPRLLAVDPRRAAVRVSASQRGIVLRNHVLQAQEGFALGFEHNAAATIERPNVQWSEGVTASGWSALGALYVLRFGRELTPDAAADIFDLLLTRHLSGLKP
jgi:hypothetical protein